MKKLTIDSDKVHAAYKNWVEFHNLKKLNMPEGAFLDFLDPVRQTDLPAFAAEEPDEGGLYTYTGLLEVTEQVAKRVEALAGPHYYAFLTANEGRRSTSYTSWGKGWKS